MNPDDDGGARVGPPLPPGVHTGTVLDGFLPMQLPTFPGSKIMVRGKGYTHVGHQPQKGQCRRPRPRTVSLTPKADARVFQMERIGRRFERSIRQDEGAWAMWRGRMVAP